jgi:WXG100 family type VII secretion target
VTFGVSQFQAETAVMESTASKFESANETLQTTLRRLMTELEVLQTAWRGAGGSTFTQTKQAWSENQEAIQRALLETANAIRTSGRQYGTSDTEAASRIATTNRGVNLPL